MSLNRLLAAVAAIAAAVVVTAPLGARQDVALKDLMPKGGEPPQVPAGAPGGGPLCLRERPANRAGVIRLVQGPAGARPSHRRYRQPGHWHDGLPAEKQAQLAARYADIFGVFLRHREAVARETFWGVSDADSWLNRGRVNHPLLWDWQRRPKPAFQAVAEVLKRSR